MGLHPRSTATYDATTGRRSGRAYRATWHAGRIVFWAPVAVIALVLIYFVYFHKGGRL